MHRFAHVEKFSRRFLRGNARALDKIDIRLRAAIANRRLIRVHFYDGIVHAHRGQRSQHVLDCVHAHRTFPDGGRALHRLQIVDLCINSRLVLQIFALEFDPVIGRCRLQFQ